MEAEDAELDLMEARGEASVEQQVERRHGPRPEEKELNHVIVPGGDNRHQPNLCHEVPRAAIQIAIRSERSPKTSSIQLSYVSDMARPLKKTRDVRLPLLHRRRLRSQSI